MTNEDLTVIVLDKLNWYYDTVLNPERKSSTTELLAGDVILQLLLHSTAEKAAPILGVGSSTLSRVLANVFVPIFGKLNGGNETWKYVLLTYSEYKSCSSCHEILPFQLFDSDKYNSSGKYSCCKECRKALNAQSYKKENTQLAHKKSQEKHYYDILARNAVYRAERAKRNVAWADHEKIKEIYKNCPEGMHVDHEIPLKGELVSGLHVHNNLQYLSPEDNIKKGNRFEI